ncbi:MAG: flavodoxin family protein [Patescibacteria group bacterium]
MNIVAVCGSPRKGNTEFILKRFLIGAEDFGHKTDLVLLREKKIERCGGCLACDDDGVCGIRDDMNAIIEKLKANDLIVFGSPNYFSNVSGLMKDFFDRLHPVLVDDKLSGKKAIAIMAGEAEEAKSAEAAIATMTSVVDSFKMTMIGDLYLSGKKAQDVETNTESVQKIDDFAKNILS